MSTKFVVAIGYSEGGIEPLLSFFDHVPHDQVTYIILRHIPIDQRSVLSEILERHSRLTVLEAANGEVIEKDKIYIPPTNSYITIKNDMLYLQPRVMVSRSYNWSINIFLQSLAVSKKEKSIAVIFSGSGVDGAQGASLIHEAGGVVMVQTPEDCIDAGMPNAAIKAGCVDYILTPSEMPIRIQKHVSSILKNANEIKRLKA